MVTKIVVKEGTLERKILFPQSFDMSNRLCLLYGANSVGKTTLIKGIKDKTVDIISNRDYDVMTFTNSVDNCRENNPIDFNQNYAKLLIKRMQANHLSEGQSIIFSLMPLITAIKDKV